MPSSSQSASSRLREYSAHDADVGIGGVPLTLTSTRLPRRGASGHGAPIGRIMEAGAHPADPSPPFPVSMPQKSRSPRTAFQLCPGDEPPISQGRASGGSAARETTRTRCLQFNIPGGHAEERRIGIEPGNYRIPNDRVSAQLNQPSRDRALRWKGEKPLRHRLGPLPCG